MKNLHSEPTEQRPWPVDWQEAETVEEADWLAKSQNWSDNQEFLSYFNYAWKLFAFNDARERYLKEKEKR